MNKALTLGSLFDGFGNIPDGWDSIGNYSSLGIRNRAVPNQSNNKKTAAIKASWRYKSN